MGELDGLKPQKEGKEHIKLGNQRRGASQYLIYQIEQEVKFENNGDEDGFIMAVILQLPPLLDHRHAPL